MNIAHILSHLSAVHAGVPIGTRHMVSALHHLGLGVSLWATGRPDAEGGSEEGGFPIHLYETKRPVGWRRSPGLAEALVGAAATSDIFHVHEVWNYPQLIATRRAKKAGVPYILAPRASLEPWRMARKGIKKQIYLRLFGDRVIRNATCMHAVATAEVEGFRKAGYDGPVFVAHNGIVPEEFDHLPDPVDAELHWPKLKDRRVVLYLSRLSPEKGLDKFIPAWASVIRKSSYTDALLVLAGPDDRGYRCQVEGMVRQEGVESSVLLTGMVEGGDKLKLMSRADLFVLPSYSEGFSNSVLENLAAGNPVLITPGCNFPEVTEVNAGLIVQPEQKAIEDALKYLLDLSHEERVQMGDNGRRLVSEHYTWDIAARRIATDYTAILKGKEIPLYPEPIHIGADGRALIE
jgi:glycosyltransferase involved in cell wall biosynthesis